LFTKEDSVLRKHPRDPVTEIADDFVVTSSWTPGQSLAARRQRAPWSVGKVAPADEKLDCCCKVGFCWERSSRGVGRGNKPRQHVTSTIGLPDVTPANHRNLSQTSDLLGLDPVEHYASGLQQKWQNSFESLRDRAKPVGPAAVQKCCSLHSRTFGQFGRCSVGLTDYEGGKGSHAELTMCMDSDATTFTYEPAKYTAA
jgi:hypothetical protein